MTITVKRRWMEHSTGTKFYQLFHFFRSDTRLLPHGGLITRTHTLTHWGAMKIAKGSTEPRPVNGGQVQHLEGVEFAIKTSEKTALRKGERYSVVSDRDEVFTMTSAFETWLIEQVGAEEAHPIMVALSLRGGDTRLETADDESASAWPGLDKHMPAKRTPKAPAETAPIARPDGWGAW